MKKNEIKKDIEQKIGTWPNVSQIAEYLGWSRDRVRAMMADADRLDGHQKQYYSGDVAEKILSMRVM